MSSLVGVRGLRVICIIGLRPHERITPQPLVVDFDMLGLDIDSVAANDDFEGLDSDKTVLVQGAPPTIDYARASKAIGSMLVEQQFQTIEAAAVAVCEVLCLEFMAPGCSVTLAKPAALSSCVGSLGADGELGGPRVSIQRTRDEILSAPYRVLSRNPRQQRDDRLLVSSTPAGAAADRIFLALGSNVGNRVGNIHRAIQLLEEHCTVVNSSHLYETKPAYVEDQPAFLNAVIEVRSVLAADLPELLRFVKRIERAVGRTPGAVRYGPRTIDVDILLAGQRSCRISQVDELGSLIVPHALMAERDFVLVPLCDIDSTIKHPILGKSVGDLVVSSFGGLPKLQRVLPMGATFAAAARDVDTSAFADQEPPLWKYPFDTPVVMGIINATPDSFSDGGKHASSASAAARAAALAQEGARIIDIGGQSTRPNAPVVSANDEWARLAEVLPAVRERLHVEAPTAAVSLDTFSADCAEKALEGGWVDLINDVSACAADTRMIDVVRRYRCPIAVTHSRLDSGGHSTEACKYEYAGADVVYAVRTELQNILGNLLRAGVLRWQLIIDPGAGFAKKSSQTLEVLRQLHDLGLAKEGDVGDTDCGALGQFPLMIGVSRKGFIGTICDRPNSDDSRDIGSTAVAVTAFSAAALLASNPSRDATVDIVRCHAASLHRDALLAAHAVLNGAS